MKKLIKGLIPPLLLEILKKLIPTRYGWHGRYSTWKEAQTASSGYDSNEILEKVKSSLLKVKNGEAVYERDSVLFEEIQYSWALLTGLMFFAAKSGGKLRVLDFGGSLGSTYFQNKKFLDAIGDVSWSVVEQKHFVEVGKREFEDKRLKFYYDAKTCIEKENPNILLLSSVLQYLEKPYEFLEGLLDFEFESVVLDLTAVSTGSEFLTVQKVPPSIYNATYPCWMLDQTKLDSLFEKKGYHLVERFAALNGYEVFSNGKRIGKYIGEIRSKK